MNFRLSIMRVVFALGVLVAVNSSVQARPIDWKPIEPSHLQLSAPLVEKDADAEAIFWEVRIQDELDGSVLRTVYWNYIRIKIFNDRGKESESRVDIPYASRNKVTNIAGRTIKPDGTIIELGKDAVFDRTIVKVGGLKVNAKSFVMPAVEPGCIIEYRWREVYPDHISFYVKLQFSREIPVQVVKYYLKPLRNVDASMRALTFNGQMTPFEKEKDGFFSTMMTNVPAFKEEPRMPPDDEVRPWMLVYYTFDDRRMTPEAYWKDYGKREFNKYKSEIRVNDDIRRAVAQIVGSASDPDEKLQLIYQFCRTRITNVSDDASGLSSDEISKLKDNKTSVDTLKRGVGTAYDIDMLFAALTTAAGFDVRVAKLADRGRRFFDPSYTDGYFTPTYNIAVKVGNNWRFFDAGTPYVPYGMLRWQEEGVKALVTDPKEPVWVDTPVSPPDRSVQRRTARLKLSENGTLEGEVRIEYSGHFAVYHKQQNAGETTEQRESTLVDMVKRHLSTAELRNIKVENVTDPVEPFVYSFDIRVPGYAQPTGRRLFVQPSFFTKGVGAMFPTSSRSYPIYFYYPWKEVDYVTIELPEGFSLDSADSPGPFTAGDVAKYDIKIRVLNDRTLEFERSFWVNGLIFPKSSYGPLKQMFDSLHERDNHIITLKQE